MVDPSDPMAEFRAAAEDYVRMKLKERYGVESEVVLRESSDYADLVFPCFGVSKDLGLPPDELARQLAAGAGSLSDLMSATALNGYLNFRLDLSKVAARTIKAILGLLDAYGRSDAPGRKTIVEHTSTNPTGPIHVGRARNPIIGDTLVRILEQVGTDVSSEFYVNNLGRQFVTLVWALEHLTFERDLSLRADYDLVRLYRHANELQENQKEVSQQVDRYMVNLEEGDRELLRRVRSTSEEILLGIRSSLSSINVTIETYTFESDLVASGAVSQTVERLRNSGRLTVDDGLYLTLPNTTSKSGEDQERRVYFARANGTSTYLTRDLAYHLDKFRRAERVVDVLGEDHKAEADSLRTALGIIGEPRVPDLLFYSFVSLPEGKMSTRKGLVVYLDDLVEESIARARREVEKRRGSLDEKTKEGIARAIGVGAVRYNIVRIQPGRQLVFKWDEALNFEGDSAPFILYAYVRASKLLRSAGDSWSPNPDAKLREEAELKLCKQLALLPSELKAITSELSVNRLPSFAHRTAVLFNKFYDTLPVLNAPGDLRRNRLTLVQCTATVLKICLGCLGISRVEEM